MSSTIGFLAYAFDRAEPREHTVARLDHAGKHLEPLYLARLTRHGIGDLSSGMYLWEPEDTAVRWNSFERRGDVATAWLHVPSVAGAPGSLDEWLLADSVLDGTVRADVIAPPFAVARWARGQLDIVNDLIGAVRLFHYRFDDGDVWTTRMGLAHVFMGAAPGYNTQAWSGMAAIGWAPAGSTQMGRGHHVEGGIRIRAGQRSGRTERRFAQWFTETRSAESDSIEVQARDMERVMASALRWPEPVVADLTGGKDSRLIASLGIKSRTVSTVRTVETDHGEVEAARALVGMLDAPVTHLVVPVRDVSVSGADFITRVSSSHLPWEGRWSATVAFANAPFAGIRSPRHASFNGLGGEVLAGGALWQGRNRETMLRAPRGEAMSRMARMAALGLGASRDAREETVEALRMYVVAAEELGVEHAGGVLDLVYMRDRMPYWASTFSTPMNLCPLFAPSMLRTGARSVGDPVADGLQHRALIAQAIPTWSTFPFYKPAGHTRLVRSRVWETEEWPAVSEYVRDRAGALPTFDADAVVKVVDDIEQGDGGKAQEVMIHRLVGELTFEDHRLRVARDARALAKELDRLRARERGRSWRRFTLGRGGGHRR